MSNQTIQSSERFASEAVSNPRGWCIYSLLIGRLFLIFLLYTLSRLVFYIYNADLLHIDSSEELWTIFRGGLVFDTSGIIYVNLLVIALHLFPLPLSLKYSDGYQRVLKWIYMTCNIPAFVLNLGDVVYYRFSGRRTSLSILQEFGGENPFKFLYFFLDYWSITLVGVAMIVALIYLYGKMPIRKPTPRIPPIVYYPLATLVFVIGGVLCVGGIRGGLGHAIRPISPSYALRYIKRPEQMPLVLNTPFNMIRLVGKFILPEYSFMSEDEARRLFDPVHTATPPPSDQSGRFKGRNIVLIIWESGAKEWIGALNQDIKGYKGFTPFMDSLISRSYVFEMAFAGGGQSIDAMPALLAGIPKPQSSFITTSYASNELSSLAKGLEQVGYHTIFFHNAHTGSMGFDAMAKHLGFDEYRGREDFGDDREFDGKWGIWDEPFLQYMASELGKLPQPFFASEFTTSSHSPFEIPERYKGIYTDKGHVMHRCIRYTDHALERFFETASKQPWYDNTIFIITADHSIPGYLEEYKNSIGYYSIPMIFFDPRGELQGRDRETIVQQADLSPTVLDMVGANYPAVFFGQNMFVKDGDHFAVSSLGGGIYQLIHGDYLMQYNGQEVLALYNYKEDPRLTKDLKQTHPDKVAEHLPLMQAWLQQFSERMRLNQLTIK